MDLTMSSSPVDWLGVRFSTVVLVLFALSMLLVRIVFIHALNINTTVHHISTYADRRDQLEAVEVEKNILINIGRRNQLGVLNVM